MIWRKTFASITFRFMFSYVACLSIAVFVLLGLLFASYSYNYFREADQAVETELGRLISIYHQQGHGALITAVAVQPELAKPTFYYLLADAKRQKIAGTLAAWPESRYGSWLELEYTLICQRWRIAKEQMITRAEPLEDGEVLLVGRNYSDMILIETVIGSVLVRSMMVTIVLGALGGAVVAARSVRHVDLVNRAVSSLMSGDLSKRIPEDKSGGDFRKLVVNFNRMLDRIQTLMEGMRQVSDNVAHDLRTPLTRLRNHLASLQTTVDGAAQDTVQAMLDEADSLLATFNALLRIAQVESGQRLSGFTDIDLMVILRDVIELYEPLALDKHIAIDAQLPAQQALLGDRDLLFQAFANVLDNAIKYTPAQGSIRIRCSLDGNDICVEVADSGVGIPETDRSKVFRRFYRVESSRNEPGNGLGLSLVLAVINLHRGSVALADNQPGLRVLLRLPKPLSVQPR